MTNEQPTEVTVTLTPAQAAIVSRALNVYREYLTGSLDDKRHPIWEHFSMDRDEGVDVPGALTHEAGFLSLLDHVKEQMDAVRWEYPADYPRS
jgi:hypothetical protein